MFKTTLSIPKILKPTKYSVNTKNTVPIIVPQILPPTAPSTLLLGETDGINLCLPILHPIS